MEKCFTEPKAIGSPPNAFKIAIEFLEKIKATHVLDCPAGEGVFSSALLQKGYKVVAGDVYPQQFKLSDISCDFVNLNDKLPYDNI